MSEGARKCLKIAVGTLNTDHEDDVEEVGTEEVRQRGDHLLHSNQRAVAHHLVPAVTRTSLPLNSTNVRQRQNGVKFFFFEHRRAPVSRPCHVSRLVCSSTAER